MAAMLADHSGELYFRRMFPGDTQGVFAYKRNWMFSCIIDHEEVVILPLGCLKRKGGVIVHVDRVGLEPTTNALRVRSSTAELTIRVLALDSGHVIN